MAEHDESPLTRDESRLLKAIVDAWPQGQTDIALDANATWVGTQIGLTDAQVVTAVGLLSSKDLLHVRNLHGVMMVHPTTKALARRDGRKGLVQRIIQLVRRAKRK